MEGEVETRSNLFGWDWDGEERGKQVSQGTHDAWKATDQSNACDSGASSWKVQRAAGGGSRPAAAAARPSSEIDSRSIGRSAD